MTNNYVTCLFISLSVFSYGFRPPKQKAAEDANKAFSYLENRLLDAYWKQHPSEAIFAGYGKYYEELIIPGKMSIASDIAFAERWLDSLTKVKVTKLNSNNKISLNIIKNKLQSNIWYQSVFRRQEWDASLYNISRECDYILNQPYAPLDKKLIILTTHLQHVDDYYRAALRMLHKPTKEHIELAIRQNQGGITLFGAALSDSINASHLTEAEKSSLRQNVEKTNKAVNGYVDDLKVIIADKNYDFRSFRIGKDLYATKFKFDLATNYTPAELYRKALAEKKVYRQKMTIVANSLWRNYYDNQPKPTEDRQLVQLVLDKVEAQHATPSVFFDSLTNQVHRLKKFVIEKNLLDLDTVGTPILVRLMPEYGRGLATATAEFTPPYQLQGATYFNIDDLTTYPAEKADGLLREFNKYGSQILSIHEAVPGHCVQGIYNKKNSPDVVRSVFRNGAMIEGWAVYAEDMMLENGWGGGAPELELVFYKWKLKVLSNALIDYEIQCLNASQNSIIHFLTKECFQTNAQAEDKYHRATVSQVQLCSYYTGASVIHALRNEYKIKLGNRYTLKDFHETFLGFGSSPVNYIREQMMQ
ncbi:DUF885 domain-containing protein [Spirosoma luteolum]